MSKIESQTIWHMLTVPLLAVLLSVSVLTTRAQAQDHVLFIGIGIGYSAFGVNAYDMLVAAGADADYVLLTSDGTAAAAIHAAQLAGDPYDQIWVYDLMEGGTDPYPTDYQAIADWYNDHPDPELLCDGRFLSSYWNGRWNTEGRQLAENYYINFAARGGGLLIATDHDTYAQYGANDIGALIGINPFTGNYGGSFPVDPANPLMTTPNDLTGGLYNDSSTSQAPFNLQPNGLILHTIGYHSGNTQNPGISSTIDGSLNFTVTIDAPASGTKLCPPDAVLATTSVNQQIDPVTYTWSSSIDGALGTNATQLLNSAVLSVGMHTITVLAQDNSGLYDDDEITVSVGGPTCAPANQPPDCSSAAIADQSADGNCGATISGADVTGVTDPDGDPLTITVSPTNLVLGGNTVTVTADDGNGGTCSSDITVNVADNTAPTPDVATLPDATGECSVTLTAPTATDNCAGSITATTPDPTTYTTQGTFSVTWTYDDGNGNSSQQTQNVIVADVTAPAVTAQLILVDIPNSDRNGYAVSCSATDNCDSNPTVSSVMQIPALTNPTVELQIAARKGFEFNYQTNKVKVWGPDPQSFWSAVQSAGGVAVSNYQRLRFRTIEAQKDIYIFDVSGNLLGIRGIQTPTLVCTATDTAGNTASAGATPYGAISADQIGENDAGNLLKIQAFSENTGASENLPREFALMQNHPNPFNPTTTITFALPKAGKIKLTIHNMMGQLVKTLYHGQATAGQHQVVWNARNEQGVKVASGVYIYKLEANNSQAMKRLILMK